MSRLGSEKNLGRENLEEGLVLRLFRTAVRCPQRVCEWGKLIPILGLQAVKSIPSPPQRDTGGCLTSKTEARMGCVLEGAEAELACWPLGIQFGGGSVLNVKMHAAGASSGLGCSCGVPVEAWGHLVRILMPLNSLPSGLIAWAHSSFPFPPHFGNDVAIMLISSISLSPGIGSYLSPK